MWKTLTIGDCTDIVGGGTPSTSIPQYWGGEIPWCIPTDITKLKGKYLSTTERTITEAGLQGSAAVMLPIGTILLCSRATIGEMAIAVKPVSTNQGFKNLICKNDIDNEFLYYLLQTKISKMIELAIGSTFLEISKKALASIEINVPDLSEQRAIASILNDVDEYINTLNQLITKKKNIKRGAMQELLTGKRRLPGFEGEWTITTLGEYCPNLRKGKIITESTRIEGNIPVVAGGKTAAYYHNTYNRGENTITISASGASAGFVSFWTCKIFASDCTTIEASEKYDVRFIYYYLLNRQADIYALQTGGAQPHVQPIDLAPMIIEVTEKTEQTAIANVLSDMDTEINILKEKLEKILNIKQGMMAELLTGSIRLVNGKTADDKLAPKQIKNTKVIEFPKRDIQLGPNKKSGHNQQFDDAVTIAGIVNILYSDRYPLGRKKVQKCLYLLRRYQDESTKAFKKKAAGPYSDEIRYKGGEPIAIQQKYIQIKKGNKGTKFFIGSQIDNALQYLDNWQKTDDIQWVGDILRYKNIDELELLATIDMAICDLKEENIPISVENIKHLIHSNTEWKKKLERQIFSDKNIIRAIQELQTLFKRRK